MSVNLIMIMVFIIGVITFFVSLVGIIADQKKKKKARRDMKRQLVSENTVRAMLRFPVSGKSHSLRKSS